MKSMNELYPEIVQDIINSGIHLSPRGFRCLELRPYRCSFNSGETLLTNLNRKLSYRFMALEFLGYLLGMGIPNMGVDRQYYELVCMAARGYENFINPKTKVPDGAYGPRITSSIDSVIGELKSDIDSRRATISIWEAKPRGGVEMDSKDVPCTLSLSFSRDAEDRLSMFSVMRSNDIYWGLPYDIPSFDVILRSVSGSVGIQPGVVHHYSLSMHAYLDGPSKLDTTRVFDSSIDDQYSQCVPHLDYGSYSTSDGFRYIERLYKAVTEGCKWSETLNHVDHGPFEQFAKMIATNKPL